MDNKQYDLASIINELKTRLKEAEIDAKTSKTDDYKWGYYQAYWEVVEIMNNREI